MKYEFSKYLKELDENLTEIMVHFNNSEYYSSTRNFARNKNLNDNIGSDEMFLILLNSTKEFNNTFTNVNNSNIDSRDSLSVLIPITFIYVVIFITGVLGNITTCLGKTLI